jgi:hypothetical protein
MVAGAGSALMWRVVELVLWLGVLALLARAFA